MDYLILPTVMVVILYVSYKYQFLLIGFKKLKDNVILSHFISTSAVILHI